MPQLILAIKKMTKTFDSWPFAYKKVKLFEIFIIFFELKFMFEGAPKN